MSREFGWAYVVGSQASGPKGSVQLAGDETALDHDPNLLWSDDLNALLVSGNIIAHNFEIQNQTKTVFEFEVSGSSVFGDTPDDLHQFTGSIDASGSITAHAYYGYGGDLEGVAINEYTNFGDNRLVTSVGEKSVNAEENLTFDGSILAVVGNVQATEVSSSTSLFTTSQIQNLSVSTLTDGSITMQTGTIANIDHLQANTLEGLIVTPSQTNITDVGTLNSLEVQGDSGLSGSLTVQENVAIGLTFPRKKVEIKSSDTQLRLTNTEPIFGIQDYTYADFTVDTSGGLSITPSSGLVTIPNLNLTNLAQGSSNSILAIDANGNVVVTQVVDPGVEVKNRVVVTADYNVSTTDYFVGIQAQSDLTITLPDASTLLNGQIMVLKDESETADQHLIQVVAQPYQLIENRNSLTLASEAAAVNIYTDSQSKLFNM